VSAANVTSSGVISTLDGRAPSDIVITAKDVADPERLARMVQEQARKLAILERRWNPKRLDFVDYAVSGATDIRLDHGFGGRVRWWIGQWRATSTAANYIPLLMESASTNDTTLVLSNLDITGIGRFAGTVTIRVEAAG
jgi:hypothetical protein